MTTVEFEVVREGPAFREYRSPDPPSIALGQASGEIGVISRSDWSPPEPSLSYQGLRFTPAVRRRRMSAEDLPEQPGDAADSSEEFEARKRQRTELEQSDPYSTKESAPVDGADAAGTLPCSPDRLRL